MSGVRGLGIVLLAVALGTSSLARAGEPDAPVCPPPTPKSFTTEWMHKVIECLPLGEPTEWFAASAASMEKAPCRRKGPPSARELEQYAASIEARTPGERISRQVNGISFEDENPAMIELFERLTNFNGIGAKARAEGQKTFTSKCRKVRCAAAELFGKRQSLQLMMMLDRYGMNGSHVAWSSAVPWKADELDDVIMGLSDLPPAALPYSNNKRITRGRVADPSDRNESTIANATITFFDSWERKSSLERQMTVLHEVSHNLGARARVDDSPEWRAISGRTTTQDLVRGEIATAKDLTSLPSQYAQRNPHEDFAESCVAYRYNAAEFKRRSPKKYALIKEVVFDGLEYINAAGCAPSRSLATRVAAKAAQKLSRPPSPSPELLERVRRECANDVVAGLAKPPVPVGLDASARDCLSAAFGRAAMHEAVEEEELEFPAFTKAVIEMRPPPEASAALVDVGAAAARSELREGLKRAVAEREASHSYLYNRQEPETRAPEAFCTDGWGGKYVYQSAKALAESFSQPENTIFAFKHRDTLNQALMQTCARAHGAKPGIARLTPAEIDSGVDALIP